MDEFYNAKPHETPVTIDFCAASFFGKKPGELADPCEETRRHYYGTSLTFAEVVGELLSLGYIDRSADGPRPVYSMNLKTGTPLNAGQHEFYAGTTKEWGNASHNYDPRDAVHVYLYFNEWDMGAEECPRDDNCWGVCGLNHAAGWDYESDLMRRLSLTCGD